MLFELARCWAFERRVAENAIMQGAGDSDSGSTERATPNEVRNLSHARGGVFAWHLGWDWTGRVLRNFL